MARGEAAGAEVTAGEPRVVRGGAQWCWIEAFVVVVGEVELDPDVFVVSPDGDVSTFTGLSPLIGQTA